MKRFWLLFAFLSLLLTPSVGRADGTQAQVIIGYVTMTPQPNCPLGPCFVAYGATLPVSGGGASNATIVSPLGPSTSAAASVAVAFGSGATLPAFATTPTFNLGTSTVPVGATNFTPAQVSVGATATLIAAARTGVSGSGRVAVTIVNTSTVAVYLGGSGVTTSTGTLLPGTTGASVTINTTAAIYGIVATGTETVTEFETY